MNSIEGITWGLWLGMFLVKMLNSCQTVVALKKCTYTIFNESLVILVGFGFFDDLIRAQFFRNAKIFGIVWIPKIKKNNMLSIITSWYHFYYCSISWLHHMLDSISSKWDFSAVYTVCHSKLIIYSMINVYYIQHQVLIFNIFK